MHNVYVVNSQKINQANTKAIHHFHYHVATPYWVNRKC